MRLFIINNRKSQYSFCKRSTINSPIEIYRRTIGQSLGRDKTRSSGFRIVIHDGFIFKKDGLVYDWRIRQGILHRYVL